RNVVSHLLNELCMEGKAVKINTRPVYFLEREFYEKNKESFKSGNYNKIKIEGDVIKNSGDALKKLIGHNGSLKPQVDQCKSAASYPPKGLPMLLIGETGVGKSYIAQLIYEYAKEIKALKQHAPFIVFNCAEYANNPELLSANLMGYQMGAFTGAIRDKIGLVEEADGGFLFLDEIHRLSPEGQEKLFLFMDKGIFRRLGETGKWRNSNVRFIFATTEDPDKALLRTFLRRIPLIVDIPALSKRPASERLQLIYHFYHEEAMNIKKDIMVSRQVLNFLMGARISGNIGRMMNIIKYSCAHAYSKIVAGKIRILRIHSYDFPNDVLKEIEDVSKNSFDFNSMLIAQNGHEEYTNNKVKIKDEIDQINYKILNLISNYSLSKMNNEKFEHEVSLSINEFSDKMVFREGDYKANSLIFNMVMRIVENVLKIIEGNCGIKYYGNTAQILSHYIIYFHESLFEDRKEERAFMENLMEVVRKVFSKEYLLARKMLSIIEANLDIKFNEKASIYFTLYIRTVSNRSHADEVSSIIIAHGYSTASSISSVANRLLGQFVFEAFDMPIELSTKEIMLMVEEYIRTVDTSKGIILLVDMGSLEEIYKSLLNVVEGDIGIINNITTQLALDVGNRIILGQPIEQIIKEAVKQNNSKYKFIKSKTQSKSTILTTCMTGIGTAKKIKLLLSECIRTSNTDIIAYDYYRLKNNGINEDVFKNCNVKLIIGTSNPGVKGVPYLSLEEIITGTGQNTLSGILSNFIDPMAIEHINHEVVKMFSLQNVINHLTILNPDKIIDMVERVILRLEMGLKFKFENELKISLFIHISSMIERVITKDEMIEFSGIENFKQYHKGFLNIFKEAISVIEGTYKILIPDAEIAIIYEIIHCRAVEMDA
ncbi:MAG: transcriptional antiterminator, partial [Clostridiales bacterium]|nr:transcriptional antiterminator [Clostridiales bacterium]